MFTEKFTKKLAELYRELTPIKINGKEINYSICCDGIFYHATKNRDDYVLFLRDFTCSLSCLDKNQKIKLNELHQSTMKKIFKDEYTLALENKNTSNDLSL